MTMKQDDQGLSDHHRGNGSGISTSNQ